VDDPRKDIDGDDPFALDPALREKARRWFAEAREQTKSDDENIATWQRRLSDRMDGIGSPSFTETKDD